MSTRIGRPPTRACGECGECAECERAVKRRAAYAALTPEQRAAKSARRDRDAARRTDRARYRRHREERLARQRAYAQTPEGKAAHRAARERWQDRHPETTAARLAVRAALRSGRLAPEPCLFCGAARVHAHHHDYTRWLEVTWLCPLHHRLAHANHGP